MGQFLVLAKRSKTAEKSLSRGKGNLQLDLVNANVSSMRGEVKKKDHFQLLTSLPPPSIMCSQCGGNNINNKEAPNNIVTIQDVISIKSYLQKLRRILHDHEDDATPMIISEEQLLKSPPNNPMINTTTILDKKISRENGKNKTSEDELNDLKKQLAYVTQQNIEKDCQIASLQRQLDCKTMVTSPLRENNNRLGLIDRFEPAMKNGAPQTERVKVMSASSDSGSGYGSSNRSHSSSPAGNQ